MTTVRPLKLNSLKRDLIAGLMRMALCVGLLPCLPLVAAEPNMHWLHAGAMPPGAIGSARLLRGGPLNGYTQPVELRAPKGVTLSADQGGAYATPHEGRLLVGMPVGSISRFRAVGVPGYADVELFPTVELIDRLYPPAGKAEKFPVPIELSMDDLRLAAQGAFVTRVIYVEDPKLALPVAEQGKQLWVDVTPGEDPLVLADEMGRPIAIVRIGSRSRDAMARDGRFTDAVQLVGHEQGAKPRR